MSNLKPEKLIKQQIIEDAYSKPEKYFPIKKLEEYGFKRYECSKSKVMFWSTTKRELCGDVSVIGTYDFIGNSPSKKKMSFVEVWENWEQFISKRGYKIVERFPCVARWRDDLDFNIASIIGFQPYVTKGLVAPPNNLVSIPQNCLRFNDIENVGISGRHHTSYTMIGQLAFEKPENYNQEKYFSDLLDFFLEVCEIPINEIIVHEDAWLGGGDCGASLEFFVRGLEIANQVYMWFDMNEAKSIKDIKPLKLKVLDMGMGLERVAWVTQGSKNTYEANMPKVINHLFDLTKVNSNNEIYEKFLPFSGTLNLDEVDNINVEWEKISKKINVETKILKNEIDKIIGVYVVADTTRTLLYALSDGAIPSNVKGGYNLRIILRRALEYIKKYNWEINLFQIIKLHSQEIEKLYDLTNKENLENIEKIIEVEKQKFEEHKLKIENKLKNIKTNLNENDFIKYYISNGITPNEIYDYFKKTKNIKLEIPTNFFSKVDEYFQSQKKEKTKKEQNLEFLPFIENIKDTKLIYYQDMYKFKIENVEILKKFELNNNSYLILDKTIFYPIGGGQSSDCGKIKNYEIDYVFKVNNVIIHKIKN
jgi:alanyl-tRNA synthetase